MDSEKPAVHEKQGMQTLSVIPLYRQLSRIIEAEITNGKWKQGDKIESEAELSARFSVSRITVRAALEDLVEAGLLARIQGKGTFVTKSVGKQMIQIGSLSFSETCQLNNIQPRRVILEKKLLPATDTDMVKLGLKRGDQVVHILRILYADTIPIMLSRDHVRPEYSFLIEALNEEASLNQLMIQSGKMKSFGTAERTIEVCMATAQEADYLKVNVGVPMLLLRDLATDEHANPVRWTKEIIIGDRVRIEYKTIK